MNPLLFPAAHTGAFVLPTCELSDATACTVHEELNNRYTAQLTLPAASRHFGDLEDKAILLLKPNAHDAPQPFRVCSDGRSSRMETTLQLQHLSYDLDGYPVAPFTAGTAAEAVAAINRGHILSAQPFTITTNISKTRSMEVTVPTVARALLGEHDQSLLRRYGGELRFDTYNVELLERRGADRGFVMEYGKNLLDVKQERNLNNLYAGVLPYWRGTDSTVSGNVRNAPGSFPVQRILPVDFSAQFDEQPTVAQLNNMGDTYITEEHIGVPEVSLTLTCVPPGARGLKELEQLQLGDTVTVEFEKLGISVQARVIAYTWDVLNERYLSLVIGSKQETAASALSDASRLTRGTVDPARFAPRSIGGGALRGGAVGAKELANNSVTAIKIRDGAVVTEKISADAVTAEKLLAGAVTVNKIASGAVVSDKIAIDAVTAEKILAGAVKGAKVADKAISYAKLSGSLQVTIADVLTANALFAEVIQADKSVAASVVTVRNYLSVGGTVYRPTTYTVKDTRNVYTVYNTQGSMRQYVYNNDGDTIGHATEYWYTASLGRDDFTNVTYRLNVLGASNAN